VYNIFSYTYVHLLVLIYLIFRCSAVDHLKLNFIIIPCQFNVVCCMKLIIREDERWKMKAIRFFGVSRTTYPVTRRLVPEYRNP
jgi:D-alanyl-lipoteichoic acid acyltransferase DltB (MBOAT superfamily)